MFQNFKGFIYLGFLILFSFLRSQIIFWMKKIDDVEYVSPNAICNMVQYSKYGNAGFSIFVIAFTFFYICMPMFLNNDINYLVFGGLLTYLIADIAIRYSKKCLHSPIHIIFNIIAGGSLGVLVPYIFYALGGSKFMFFNEISSNKEVCSMPKKQTFKCAVYKNGELVGSTTS